MDDELNGRRVVLWADDGDPYKNLEALAVAITTSAADLFNIDGVLFWLKEGKLISVAGAALAEIIRTFVVTKGIRNAGTADTPMYERRFIPFEVSEMLIRSLIQRGDLLARVPKIFSGTGTANTVPELPRWAMQEIASQR
jgi:hypothetical protein